MTGVTVKRERTLCSWCMRPWPGQLTDMDCGLKLCPECQPKHRQSTCEECRDHAA